MSLTDKQLEAVDVMSGDATHIRLMGGSRSGKTYVAVRCIVVRALKAANSRHGIFRFRYNAVMESVYLDTFPKVMATEFPGVTWNFNAKYSFVQYENGSEMWFSGLDDKERVEKVLGKEFSTIYFNECSQIPYASVLHALTRLAQLVSQCIDNIVSELKLRVYYDLNPGIDTHWSYSVFTKKIEPIGKKPYSNPNDYASIQMNPVDNAANIASTYLASLQDLPAHLKKRFYYGEYGDSNPNALFGFDVIESNRVINTRIPDMVRIVVAVDPSGAGDNDTTEHDAIGIVAAGLGVDGRAYVLEDCTVTAGPVVWGKIATDLYDRLEANCIVGEVNFGGAMVNHVIQTSRSRTPYKEVRASRGKQVRAEPFSALYNQGKVRHVGFLPELEDELQAFSTIGYTGIGSPNRADALIWCLAELFPAMVAPRDTKKPPKLPRYAPTIPSMGY